jgi:uncharacterized repeat protein (TIGR03987 family)
MVITVWMSATLITLALIFYSIGIWAERFARYLKKWHVLFFWLGLIFDALGTYAMHRIATKPFNILEPHTMTGQAAIWLMLIHAVWATYVVFNGSEKSHRSFHKYSLIVWTVWLVPYIGGIFLGMYKQ